VPEIWREGEDGLLELVDTDTGHVLSRQARPKNAQVRKDGKIAKKKGRRTRIDVRDGNGVLHRDCPAGINPASLAHTVYVPNLVTFENICDRVRDGYSLRQIGKMDGYPPINIIFRWKEKHPEFEASLKAAAKSRGWFMMESLIDQIAEVDGMHKDDVPAERLKHDIRKLVAERFNPEEFGPRTKLDATGISAAPVVIITGIARDGDDAKGALPTTARPIGHAESLSPPPEAAPEVIGPSPSTDAPDEEDAG
jgi:hypothetical protein